MSAALACQREHFSLPDDFHYLNCAYMGPLPKASDAEAVRGIQLKRFPQSVSAEDFFTPVTELRTRFASLINAPNPESIAVLPSVSYGVSTVTKNTEIEPGQNVVLVHEQFPGNVYPWHRLVKDRGAEVRVVTPPDSGRGSGWSERILSAIDENTVAVAMGTVHWTDGTRFDLSAVRERTDRFGAAFVLDGSQSVGALPIDVQALKPDALICAGYKWLLGPYSLCLGYFGERYMGGVPLEETWTGRKGAEDFAGLVDYVDEYQPGAIRFDVGERSNFALVPALSASLELLLQWKPARIEAYCKELFRDALPQIRDLGLLIEDDPWRSAHLFGIRLADSMSLPKMKAAFEAHRVGVSFRGSSIRVSPNVYNTSEDVGALLAALTEGVG
ncbi:MAG: aminotransferase class V-fold PLP-dependent enzyme [Longimicrobiales bacterium]